MECTFISNTCCGWTLMRHYNIDPYNNPFIGSLIQCDEDYLKLINNFNYYMNFDPILGNPKQNYYKHRDIKTPYPVIFLRDIEVHFIHEENFTECLNKVIKRMQRYREWLNENKKIYVILSFSELLNDHNDVAFFINEFLKPTTNETIIKIFLGPSKYNIENKQHYINVDEWNNVDLIRDESGVYNFNNQPFITNKCISYINELM